MNLTDPLLLLTAVINIILGFIVLFKDRKNQINIIFSVCIFSLALWVASFFIMRMTMQPYVPFQLAVALSTVTASTFFHFTLIYPKNEPVSMLIVSLIYFPALLFSISVGKVISSSIVLPIGFKNEYGALYPFYAIYIPALFCSGLGVLVKKYKNSTGIFRTQLKYIFFGVLLTFGVIFVTNLILPILGSSKYSGIGPLASIIFVSAVSYAIVKHRLMDIEVIIRKSVIYSALVAAITGTYVLLTLSIGEVMHNITGQGSLMVTLLTALIIVVGYRPLEDFIEKTTEKIFFRGKYDYQVTLNKLIRDISMVMNIDLLMSLIIKTISEAMRVDKISVNIKDEGHKWKQMELSDDVENGKIISKLRKMDEVLAEHLARKNAIISIDDIEEEINSGKLTDHKRNDLSHIKKLFMQKRISICAPFISKNDLMGALNLGGKLSGDIYSRQDLELLSIMCNQASVAMENARLYHQLERAERLAVLGKFAGSLAHEIRNPLVSIKTFFQILNSDEDPEDKQEISDLASQEIERMEELLDNLLGFAKPSAERFVMEEVNKVLHDSVMLIKHEASAKGIEIKTQLEAGPCKLSMDPNQIQQVFMNVMMNAIQAMDEGGELRIKTSHHKGENQVDIVIEDTGHGISDDDLPKLFEPFYTTKEKGVGLGLSISQRIIVSHNGDINIESEKGKGTSVHIMLPTG